MRFGRMPRFYLHVCDGLGFAENEEGTEVAGIGAARQKAIAAARDIMAAEIQRGELDLGSFIEVEDENRKYLFTVTFADAIEVKRALAGAVEPRRAEPN